MGRPVCLLISGPLGALKGDRPLLACPPLFPSYLRHSCLFGVSYVTKRKVNPIEVVREQYQQLKEKLESTCDIQEKNILFRRLANLLAVMQFLISTHNNNS